MDKRPLITNYSEIIFCVNSYKEQIKKIEDYLSSYPNENDKLQQEFNTILDNMFRYIGNFEEYNTIEGRIDNISMFKDYFNKEIRSLFLKGEYIPWSLKKPYGYAGDFKIIDDIYKNSPSTEGFERLLDNYYQMSAIAAAVRNRKEDFKKFIKDFLAKSFSDKVYIMDLVSGSCRIEKELLEEDRSIRDKVYFDCYDSDSKALEFGEKILCDYLDIVSFNNLQTVLRKKVNISKKYHLIFSCGLLDYFSKRLSIMTVRNFYDLLLPGGLLIIANVKNKSDNPNATFMEWVLEWYLVYKSEEEFKNIFIEAGIENECLTLQYEKQGIVQYALVKKM